MNRGLVKVYIFCNDIYNQKTYLIAFITAVHPQF